MASNGAGSYASAIPSGRGDSIVQTLSRTLSRRPEDQESGYDEEEDTPISKAENWRLMGAVREFHANDKGEGRRLGVTWNNLTIKGVRSGTAIHDNFLSQFNIPQQIKGGRAKAGTATIVNSSSGSVRPGQMLLVLGRPGAGCTSLLKVLGNRKKGYIQIQPCGFKAYPLTGTGTQRLQATCTTAIWISRRPSSIVGRSS
jgi:ABC-type multidrug transport system fused ATPase/permease subunit